MQTGQLNQSYTYPQLFENSVLRINNPITHYHQLGLMTIIGYQGHV